MDLTLEPVDQVDIYENRKRKKFLSLLFFF